MNIVRSFSTQKLKFFCIIVFLVLAMASSDIAAFQSVFNTQQIKLKDELLDKIYKHFKIYIISKFEEITTINEMKNDTKVIVFDLIEYLDAEYLIACFDNTIIIISKSNESSFKFFLHA